MFYLEGKEVLIIKECWVYIIDENLIFIKKRKYFILIKYLNILFYYLTRIFSMKTLITLFAVLFAISLTMANAGESFLQSEFIRGHHKDIGKLYSAYDFMLDEMNDNNNLIHEQFLISKKKKADEMLGDKYLPSVVKTTDISGNEKRFSFTYDSQGNILSYFREDGSNEQWVNYFMRSMTYDNAGNMLTNLLETWNDGQWVNSSRSSKVFDQMGNMLEDFQETWKDGQWVNSMRFTFTYDNEGNNLTSQVESWQEEQWVKLFQVNYTYDQYGNRLNYVSEQWGGEQWVKTFRGTYTYDNAGNMLTSQIDRWTDGQWVNTSRDTFTYDNEGNLLTYLSESWTDEQWVNSTRYTYTYDNNGNELSELSELWQDGIWVNSDRYLFTYDDNGNMLSELSELWQDEQWNNSSRYTYTYDDDGNMLIGISEVYIDENWELEGGYFNLPIPIFNFYTGVKIELTWMSITSVESENSESDLLQISPNPANDNIIITLPDGILSQELNIRNNLGDIVKTISLTTISGIHNIEISANEFPAGIYYCTYINGQTNITKSFVVVR